MSLVSDIHPRQYEKYLKKRKNLFKIDYLQNPLPNAVRDSQQLKRLFASFPYIPYATSENWTSHRLVELLYSMNKLSSTQNACVRSKKLFGFGGKIKFSKAMDDIYDLEEEKVYLQGQELLNRIEFMKSIDHYGLDPLRAIQRGYEFFEATGDIWIEVVLGQVGPEKGAGIEVHDCRNVLLKVQNDQEEEEGVEYVGVCADWELAYTTEPVRHVSLYPNFIQDEDGLYRTMIHVKHGEGDFYGRPPSQGSLVSQYNEYQDAIYLLKIGRKNFTGQIIYEMEDDGGFEDLDEKAQDDGYDNFGHQLEQNMTNEAEEPMTVLVHTRPYGGRPSVLHQVKPGTSETWHNVTKEIYRERIVLSHQWSERLLGLNVGNGWDSNVYWDEAIVKLMTVIQPLRNEVLSGFNEAYAVIAEFMGVDPEIQLNIKSVADEILEQKMKEKEEMKQMLKGGPKDQEEDDQEEDDPEEEEVTEEPEEENSEDE